MDPLRLSEHLTWAEFVATSHREFLEEQAAAPAEVVANARRFALDLFEPARTILGPLHVTSGYRCPVLNAAVGGSTSSAHVLGLAADVVPVELGLVAAFERLVGSDLAFDQLIYEYGRWIHLGGPTHGRSPRRQALMKFEGKGYEPWDPTHPWVLAHH